MSFFRAVPYHPIGSPAACNFLRYFIVSVFHHPNSSNFRMISGGMSIFSRVWSSFWSKFIR